MTIDFNGKKFELKYGFRQLMMYENIAKESFQPTSLTSIINFFYAILLSQSMNDPIDYDKFLDWLDKNPEILTDFSNWLVQVLTTNSSISNTDTKKKNKKEETPKN